MQIKQLQKHFDEVYEMKKKGMWGYKWHKYSELEKKGLILLNLLQPPRFIWRLFELVFPQVSLVSSIKCRCRKYYRIVHLFNYHV